MRLDFSEEHAFHRGPLTTYPIIPIAMLGRGGKRVDTFALLDSGADDCLFHAKWLKRIGLRLKNGRKETRGSIEEGASITCYVHRISMLVGHQTKSFRCEVAFSEEIGEDLSDQLLGRDVIFERFRFGIRQKVEMLYMGRER